ncbi:MAG: hypothetical protein AMJ46_13225 [Latescibacteria bacterium DG_63]|nr:MAG: hypothetical protein AMJ46_13225 [Latescibacteria bacterium DG_63]
MKVGLQSNCACHVYLCHLQVLPFSPISGNPAICERPVALRNYLAIALPFSEISFPLFVCVGSITYACRFFCNAYYI